MFFGALLCLETSIFQGGVSSGDTATGTCRGAASIPVGMEILGTNVPSPGGERGRSPLHPSQRVEMTSLKLHLL